MSLGRGEDDVQLIEIAEAADERLERLDDAAVFGQQRQDVGVERQTANALDGDERRAEHDREHGKTPAIRGANDRRDERGHSRYAIFTNPSLR
jgi:hypothetical protein